MRNMKKACYMALAAISAAVLLSACGPHSHKWRDVTCVEPQTCKECGKTQGEPTNQHQWKDATCTDPKTCEVCGETEGKPLGHRAGDWETEIEATLSRDGVNVKRCLECGEEVDSEDVVKYINIEDGAFNFTAEELIDYLELDTTQKIDRGEIYDEGSRSLTNYIATVKEETLYEVNIITEGRYLSDPAQAVVIDISSDKESYPKEILEKIQAKLQPTGSRGNQNDIDLEKLTVDSEPCTFFENRDFKVETQKKEHFLVCLSPVDEGLETTTDFVDSILHIPFYLDVTFNKNIIFDKYGVDVWVNEDKIASLEHGEGFTKLLTVPRGDYTLKFVSQKDASVTAEDTVHVNGPTTIKCKIQTHSGDIEFKEYEVLSNVNSAMILMPYVVGMTLDKAEEALAACGFIDVRSDIVGWFYSKSDYQVIAQKPEAGTANEYNTVITLSCITVESAQSVDNTTPTVTPGPTPTPKPTEEEEAAEAESGYEKAFVRELSNYSIYYMFDQDTHTVCYFYTDDTSIIEGIFTGDFEDRIDIEWTSEGFAEKLVMGKDGKATLIDSNGAEWEYQECSVGKAELAKQEITSKWT